LAACHEMFDIIKFLLLLPFTVPFVVLYIVFWTLTTVVLYTLVWLLWSTRGKDILFVYSDSPVWHDYIEERIVPRIETRSIILNWSNRRHWLGGWSLQSLVFCHFGGHREYNPMALYFRPFWLHRSFRCFEAFRDWKHGKPERLKQLENDFFHRIG
jgi:hypothetical protein